MRGEKPAMSRKAGEKPAMLQLNLIFIIINELLLKNCV